MSLRTAQLERARAEQRQAVRALLARPLLTADGPAADVFVLVRRHASELRAFFAEQAGWTLQVGRETARLRKAPAVLGDGSRPARARAKDPPFSARRYVLLCLALAALERSDRQITLRRIAETVATMVADDEELRAAGIEFELTGRDQRRDLVATVRWLLEHRVIRRVEGEEDAFVADRGDVLYQVDRQVLAWVLASARPPSALDAGLLPGADGSGGEPLGGTAGDAFEARLADLGEELQLESDESRRRGLRHALVRRLLDDPVVYYDELSEAERDYLQRSRAAILPRLEAMTGLVAEVRAEGIALVDPRGDASDVALPEEGTDGHVTLLIAELLVERARDGIGVVSVAEIHAHVRELMERHGRAWRKAATEPGAEVELTERALTHLAGLALVRRTREGVVPRPAIGRFALAEVAAAEVPVASEQQELFS